MCTSTFGAEESSVRVLARTARTIDWPYWGAPISASNDPGSAVTRQTPSVGAGDSGRTCIDVRTPCAPKRAGGRGSPQKGARSPGAAVVMCTVSSRLSTPPPSRLRARPRTRIGADSTSNSRRNTSPAAAAGVASVTSAAARTPGIGVAGSRGFPGRVWGPRRVDGRIPRGSGCRRRSRGRARGRARLRGLPVGSAAF